VRLGQSDSDRYQQMMADHGIPAGVDVGQVMARYAELRAVVFLCKHCKKPPDEWGVDRRCPAYPATEIPSYMRVCEYEKGA
jgi:hypothetical protein